MAEVVIVEGVISNVYPSLGRVAETSKCVLGKKEVAEHESQTNKRERRMEIPLCEGSAVLVLWPKNLTQL